MVKAEFSLFQVQQKRVFEHASKLVETGFNEAPERLNTISVRSALNEFVLAVADAKVAVKSHIRQPVVVTSAIASDYGHHINFAENNSLPRLFQAIRNDFRVHLPTAFEQAKDNNFAARSPARLAS